MRAFRVLPETERDRLTNVRRYDVEGRVVHVSTQMIAMMGEGIPMLLDMAMDIVESMDVPDYVEVTLPVPEVDASGDTTYRAEWFQTEAPRSTDGEWDPA